tara:strand:+ start:227 stop:424 length:198 start_codon:yes stop_codon:yes gene_type:complete
VIPLNPYTSSLGAAYDPYASEAGSSGILDGDNRVMNTLNTPVFAGFDVGHIALVVGALYLAKMMK